MARNRRPVRRQLGERRYKRMFVIVTEGEITEPEYFSKFDGNQSIVKVNCLKEKHSDPLSVLRRMKRFLREEGLEKGDESWLVVYRDEWKEEQLSPLHKWSKTDNRFGLALSNPKFEYWLLLHFEDAKGVKTPGTCTRKLKEHLPRYKKTLDLSKFTDDKVRDAIRRAKVRDKPPCKDWPRSGGKTTVYRLVENILKG